jgi:hypothetical protein
MLAEMSFAPGCLIVQIWNLISLQSEHWSAIPLAPGSFGHWLTAEDYRPVNWRAKQECSKPDLTV